MRGRSSLRQYQPAIAFLPVEDSLFASGKMVLLNCAAAPLRSCISTDGASVRRQSLRPDAHGPGIPFQRVNLDMCFFTEMPKNTDMFPAQLPPVMKTLPLARRPHEMVKCFRVNAPTACLPVACEKCMFRTHTIKWHGLHSEDATKYRFAALGNR